MQDLTNIASYEIEATTRNGESQRSNMFSGMPKKDRLLVSHLIKTHRIAVIIAIFKPEQ